MLPRRLKLYHYRIANWRSFVPFVQGVEHDLRIVQLEERPATLVTRQIRRNDLEAKQITVERDCFRHVENPEERTHAFDFQSDRKPPLFSGIYDA